MRSACADAAPPPAIAGIVIALFTALSLMLDLLAVPVDAPPPPPAR